MPGERRRRGFGWRSFVKPLSGVEGTGPAVVTPDPAQERLEARKRGDRVDVVDGAHRRASTSGCGL